MRSVAITEFKAKCLSILEGVARSGESVLVLKHGKPLARVLSATEDGGRYPQDTLAGTVETTGDVVGPVLPAGTWGVHARKATRAR